MVEDKGRRGGSESHPSSHLCGALRDVARVYYIFLISQCIIYQKKAQSASKYTRITQSATSIQRKPKTSMPLGTQKVYQGAQKKKINKKNKKKKIKKKPDTTQLQQRPK
jgi:hypothetical protein